MRRTGRLCTALSLVALLLSCAWGTGCSSGCESDADCAAGERCQGVAFASCEPQECETDGDCAAGYQCTKLFSNYCTPTCRALQCGHGTACVEGLLGGASCQPGCKSNDDCPANTFCQGCAFLCFQAPQCVPGCHDDGECGAGQFCRSGKCLEQCFDDSDCPRGTLCNKGLDSLLGDAGASCFEGVPCRCVDCVGTPACAPTDGGADAASDARPRGDGG